MVFYFLDRIGYCILQCFSFGYLVYQQTNCEGPPTGQREVPHSKVVGLILSSTQWCIQLKTSCRGELAERGRRRVVKEKENLSM